MKPFNLIFSALFLISSFSFAQDYLGTTNLALGGGQAAGKILNDGIYVNPATLSLKKVYAVTGYYLEGRQSFAASILDSKTTTFTGGLSYINQKIADFDNPANKIQNHFFHVATSYMVDEKFSFGVSGKYSLAQGEKKYLSAWNVNAGILFQPIEMIRIGGVIYNVLANDNSTTFFGDRKYQLGADVSPVEGLTGSYDLSFSQSQSEIIDHAIGLGFTFKDSFSLRAGFRIENSTNSQAASFGLGYQAKGLGLNYGFKMNVVGETNQLHSFSLSLFL